MTIKEYLERNTLKLWEKNYGNDYTTDYIKDWAGPTYYGGYANSSDTTIYQTIYNKLWTRDWTKDYSKAWEKDYVKTIERWEILKEYFTTKSIDYYEINTVGESIITKIVYLIYFLDYVSLYKSILFEIDPSPVEAIDFIKDKID